MISILFTISFLFVGSQSQQKHFPAFENWLGKYRAGKLLYLEPKNEAPSKSIQIDTLGPEGNFQKILSELLNAGNREATERLLELATLQLHPDAQEEKEKFFCQQPWAVRALALETLCKIKDPQSLRWLSTEVLLAKNQRSEAQRIVAAQVLGLAGSEPLLLPVLSALYDPSAAVRGTAAEAAGNIGGIAATQAIAQRLDDADGFVRSRCVQALNASFHSRLLKYEEPDRVRIVAAAASRLKDSDWRVRAAAGEFFRLHPDAGAVENLIEALDQEQKWIDQGIGRKRVFYQLIDALVQAAGYPVSGREVQPWKDWWATHREGYQLPSRAGERVSYLGNLPYCFGIPLRSDRVLFVLDISGSMQEELEAGFSTGNQVDAGPNRKRQTKLELAKREIRSALAKLSPTDRFNLIFFETAAYPVFDSLRRANPENLSIALERLEKTQAGGGTNVLQAMEYALRESSPNSAQQGFAEFDSLILISDGTSSDRWAADVATLLHGIEIANQKTQTLIHTVCFQSEQSSSSELMKEIARRNGGEFRSIGNR